IRRRRRHKDIRETCRELDAIIKGVPLDSEPNYADEMSRAKFNKDEDFNYNDPIPTTSLSTNSPVADATTPIVTTSPVANATNNLHTVNGDQENNTTTTSSPEAIHDA
ncbi:hypothetical protein FOL47_001882, partial [Perkinsus chesapeaki]